MDALALLSTCKDPKNFYGWNLLEKREREKSGYSSALRVLARCLAGDVVSLRHAHRLLRNLTAERSLHKIDTLGMSSLALNCMRRKFPSGSLDDRSREIAAALASSQRQTDASFDSDPITTALAIHALRCSPPVDWNESGAIRFLLDGEDDKEEGKFGGVWETTWVLPAIATNSCVIDVFQRVCPGPGDSSDPPLRLASDAGGAKTQQDSLEIRVNVTVWIGADISRRFSRIVQVPANSSVFQILLAAAAADSRFQFSADVYPWGHIVHTIDGVKFKDEGYWYWLLYTIPGPPEPLNPPNNTFIAAGGVDDVKPNDGDNILFWYRNL
ncbi:unnamed protein product [Darwinula stevensoni]|uniref:Uncharacterized protein n=1 Tax=Darwinula stevensoni TaxID=69355 RepID=A0A7R8X6D8_9CRUS|nr:unnamed protein product [Darwinula stevensoni]CAG0881996.1 unnamed protein product [Darwinula stevensoni]